MKTLMLLLFSLSALADPRIKIAVIDTGVNSARMDLMPYICADGNHSFVSTLPLEDKNTHGTNVVTLISKNIDPSKYCLLIVKYFDFETTDSNENLNKAILYAITSKAAFINMSVVGPEPDVKEFLLLDAAVKRHIRIAVAAGNLNIDLDKTCNQYPACYKVLLNDKYFHVVGSSTYRARELPYSNHGEIVKFTEDGTEVGYPVKTGTSQATAIHTGKWVHETLNP